MPELINVLGNFRYFRKLSKKRLCLVVLPKIKRFYLKPSRVINSGTVFIKTFISNYMKKNPEIPIYLKKSDLSYKFFLNLVYTWA